jgi:hypothetical protein
MYFAFTYKNRIIKPVEIVPRKKREDNLGGRAN